MGFFNRRKTAPPAQRSASPLGMWIAADGGGCPGGYRRLLDCPEVQAAIDHYAAVIGNATIYLMENTKDGDKRVRDRLARKVDVEPWIYGTRRDWVSWIVSTMMGEGDGNAFVLPHFLPSGELWNLEPMPGATAHETPDRRGYTVSWRDGEYPSDAVIHFRLFPDPKRPWKGRGYQATAKDLIEGLGGLSELEKTLSSPDYKPPIILRADTTADIFDDDAREAFRKKYLENMERGKPWILPEGFLSVEQIRPLSLADLAIKDTAELNKTALASLIGLPPFLLGVGSFDRDQYNAWIRQRVIPICNGITQTLTRALIESDKRYFVMPEKRLYSYTPMEMVTMGLQMSDRGFANGDEVREMAMMDPAGLTEYRALENYIPYDMAAQQQKLYGGGDNA